MTPPPLGGGDWLQYRHSPAGDSENPGVFAAAEAANMTQLWSFNDQRLNPKATPTGGPGYVYAQPLVTSDTIYFTTAFAMGNVVAVDAATGGIKKFRSLNSTVDAGCRSARYGFWSSAALAGGVLYVASPDGKIHALNPVTLDDIWTVQVADPTPAGPGEFIESSPAISLALNKLYVGVASSDGCAPIRGRIASIDLTTHALTTTFTVPAGVHGGTVWSSISIDEAANRIFATTGDDAAAAPGSPLTNAFVSFDAQTLAVIDWWQNPTPIEDTDFGASPTLFNAADGTPLVAAAAKDGWLYVLARNALHNGPVWKHQLAFVDPSLPHGQGTDPVAGYGSIVSPTFAHGRLFASGELTPDRAHPGSVLAFDTSGNVLWTHVTPGFVVVPAVAVGDVLFVVSNAPDFSRSWLEVLDQVSGTQLVPSFDGIRTKSTNKTQPTWGAPAVAHGMIVWSDNDQNTQLFVVPHYRP